MSEIVKAGTYDAKVNRNINISGVTQEEASKAAAQAAAVEAMGD